MLSEDTLLAYNLLRQAVTLQGLYVLGSWAVLNFLAFVPLWYRWRGSPRGYFAQMNVLWNLVNLVLAVSGWLEASEVMQLDQAAESVRQHFRLEKILLLNAGLDIAYLASAAWLLERSRRLSPRADLFKGYGWAIALQGGFLLIFDLWFFSTLNRILPNLLDLL